MTGGRIKKIKKIYWKREFMLTYGDGLSNVNLKSLMKFHAGLNFVITAMEPPARFGGIKISGKSEIL